MMSTGGKWCNVLSLAASENVPLMESVSAVEIRRGIKTHLHKPKQFTLYFKENNSTVKILRLIHAMSYCVFSQ